MINEREQSFNLWKLLVILAHRKAFIIGFVLLSTVVAVVVALLMPKWYRAKTSILPSQFDQHLGISGNFAQFSMASAGFELPLMATPSDVHAIMLKSETVGRAVIEELDLHTYFEQPSVQQCLLYMADKINVKVTPEGVIEVFYQDKDPEMAAKIANSYITHLDALNRDVRSAKAKADREFVYNRLITTRADLDSAQARLLRFQRDNSAVDLDKQRDLAINAASDIKSQLALTQVALDVKKQTYSEDHPDVLRLSREVAELEKQLRALENGSGTTSYLNLPLSDIPELSLRYAELNSELKLQQSVYGLLTEMYEETRIKEQKDTPTIAVLETAYSPEIRYKPQRTLIVVTTCAASLILAIFIALFADYLENLRRTSPTDFELLNEAKNRLTGKTGISDS